MRRCAPGRAARLFTHRGDRGVSLNRAIQVYAYAIASTLSIRTFLEGLGGGKVVRESKTHAVVAYSDTCYIVVYDFGAIVTFDMDDALRNRVLSALQKTASSDTKPPMTDNFEVHVGDEADLYVEAESMRVARLDVPLVDLIGHVLGQSVAMEYYETDVDQLVKRIDGITREVAIQGRFRGSVRALMRFIGSSMVVRNQVIGTLALLDDPPIMWEFPALEKAYLQLRQVFSIDDRYRSLDHKLRMAQDNLELIVDLARHTRSMILEIGVFILIAFEVVLFFFK
jgi:required for meiotic nuclear division protein 1